MKLCKGENTVAAKRQISKPLTGKCCYDHLGGRLGAALLELYVKNGWITLQEDTSTVYCITEQGAAAFQRMGLELDSAQET